MEKINKKRELRMFSFFVQVIRDRRITRWEEVERFHPLTDEMLEFLDEFNDVDIQEFREILEQIQMITYDED